MRYEVPLPIKGMNRTFTVDKTDAFFSDSMNNVFPVDAVENRLRLAKRPGMAKWSAVQVGAAEQPVVSFCLVSSIA